MVDTPYKQTLFKAAKEGVLEGVKSIPSMLSGKVEPERVSTYALHENLFSPNRSAKKRLQSIETRFRKEAAKEVKKSWNQLFSSPSPSSSSETPSPKPLSPKPTLTPLTLPTTSRTPSPLGPMPVPGLGSSSSKGPFSRSLVPSSNSKPLASPFPMPPSVEMKGGKQRRSYRNRRSRSRRSQSNRSKTLTRRFVKAKVLRGELV
jgi:hypothetical protein